MNRECNIGYSDEMKKALRDVLRRHGEVTSTSEQERITLSLGKWHLHSGVHFGDRPWWILVQDAEDELTCGQCTACSNLTAATIAVTARNQPYLDTETAHIVEDDVMLRALRLIAQHSWVPGLHGLGQSMDHVQELAQAAYDMAAQPRTRWYA